MLSTIATRRDAPTVAEYAAWVTEVQRWVCTGDNARLCAAAVDYGATDPGATPATTEDAHAALITAAAWWSAAGVPPDTLEALAGVWSRQTGADRYNPDDNPACDCVVCAGLSDRVDPSCLWFGVTENDRGYIHPWLLWYADDPARGSMPYPVGQLAFQRHEAQRLGRLVTVKEQANEAAERAEYVQALQAAQRRAHG